MLKAGNERMKRYSRGDLEKITSSKGGNAYHSAEEWHTDEEATQAANGQKQYKLLCVEKWWRGQNVSNQLTHLPNY